MRASDPALSTLAAWCAALAAFSLCVSPAVADEIEPEPETEVESQRAPTREPKTSPPAAAAVNEDGCQIYPSVSCTIGDHVFKLKFGTRYRWERWEAFVDNADNIHAFRTRASGDYIWNDRLRLFAEGQHAIVFDLNSSASGLAAVYRASAHNPPSNSVDSFRVRQLFGEARLDSDNYLRVGRQDLKSASAVRYEDKNWRYLKNKRLGERLLGGVGWSHGARSFDAASMRMDQEGYVLHLYAGQPTTGVFEIDRGYKRQKDIIFGGFDWTVERGTWLENTEFGTFFLGYVDDRDPSPTKMTMPSPFFGKIEAYTFGISALGVYPVGPGNFDVVLWGAGQLGQYVDGMGTSVMPMGFRRLDQVAGAGIVEVGYQLTEVWGKPWLRTGVNLATGDDEPGDGDHNSFFNVLPTNHQYYGYADALAFSNLIDLLVQFKLSPLPRLGLELAFHQFWLMEKRDFRYFGTGAFERRSLGYGRTPSNGSNNVGQEIDFVVKYKLNEHIALKGGYAHLFGGGVFNATPGDDVQWGFFQVALSY